MTEMVERVARALFQRDVEEDVCDGAWEDNPALHERILADARAAIAAMRDPAQGAQEPVMWVCLVTPKGEHEEPHIRAWTTRAERAQRFMDIEGLDMQTLYALPSTGLPAPAPHAEDDLPRHAPQTIETAPRDGTHILAWRIPVGIRVTNNTNPPTVVHWFDDPDEPGFYTSVNERAPEHPFNPTHWERLPGPPLPPARRDGK